MVKTPVGYLSGRVNKHDQTLPHGCWIAFETSFEWRLSGHQTYCHIVPFRSLKALGRVRLVRPWYMEEPYRSIRRRRHGLPQ